MTEEQNDLSAWLSTYGLITAQRILERYEIRLEQSILLEAIRNTKTFYHYLLLIPSRNVLNGIILQQAYDYQAYAQKLFVDYLLSNTNETNESSESNESNNSGDSVYQELDTQRKKLITMNEEFRQLELDQEQLISQSQANLIQHTAKWRELMLKGSQELYPHLKSQGEALDENVIIDMINYLLIADDYKKEEINITENTWQALEKRIEKSLDDEEKELIIQQMTKLKKLALSLDELLTHFLEDIDNMKKAIRQCRGDFYNFILRTQELLALSSNYRVDEDKVRKNQGSLYFDTKIGEEKD